jgi:hypothetical protein
MQLITWIQILIQIVDTRTIHQSQGLLLVEMTLWPKKKNLLNSLKYSNFHVDEHVIQEMKKLTTFATWELLVPRLKTYNLSHAIIQSCNINLLHKHY